MKNKSDEYYLEVLGLIPPSTKQEIKKAFYKLIKKWHPDKFTNDTQKILEATEKSKIINDAYFNLKNYEPILTFNNVGRIRVKSSNIHSIGYDSKKKILQIQFLNCDVYEYYDVQESIFVELMNAQSKGRYASKYIYYSYRYKKIE